MRISDWSSDVCSSDLIPTGFCDTDIFAYAVAESIVRQRGDQLVARVAALGGRLSGVEAEATDLPHAFTGRRPVGAKMRIDVAEQVRRRGWQQPRRRPVAQIIDRKSTRLNSSH